MKIKEAVWSREERRHLSLEEVLLKKCPRCELEPIRYEDYICPNKGLIAPIEKIAIFEDKKEDWKNLTLVFHLGSLYDILDFFIGEHYVGLQVTDYLEKKFRIKLKFKELPIYFKSYFNFPKKFSKESEVWGMGKRYNIKPIIAKRKNKFEGEEFFVAGIQFKNKKNFLRLSKAALELT
jgi:hypothetical protein